MDFTSMLAGGSFSPPSAFEAGWRRAQPSLSAIAGRQIILYTLFLGRPDFCIKSSTLLVDTNETKVCSSFLQTPFSEKSRMTPSTCWGSTHRNTTSDFSTTSSAESHTVTNSGKFSFSFVDLLSDRRVTHMDDTEKPRRARCGPFSGAARPVAMADAMVPHPTNPARMECGRVGGESSSPPFILCFLAVDMVRSMMLFAARRR
mmetsp:Transcript_14215/g.30941  ORF Transcript_14215/g.30941 Transcript_14215/m.30941 type:complete len:203 (+) Transcript_14215:627-1235(+)